MNTLLSKLLHLETSNNQALKHFYCQPSHCPKLKAGQELQLLRAMLCLREEHTETGIKEFQTLTQSSVKH